jgi:hypothetical protein
MLSRNKCAIYRADERYIAIFAPCRHADRRRQERRVAAGKNLLFLLKGFGGCRVAQASISAGHLLKPGGPGRFVNTPQFGTNTEAATPGREVQISMRVSF